MASIDRFEDIEAWQKARGLGPAELLRAYELILSLRSVAPAGKQGKDGAPYLRARKALHGCKGSLGDDIVAGRDDRA